MIAFEYNTGNMGILKSKYLEKYISIDNGGILDEHISDALNAVGISEIYGKSGTGKTTLLLQIISNFLLHKTKKILLINTGSNFSIDRLCQLMSDNNEKNIHLFLQNLLILNTLEVDTFHHFIKFFLEPSVPINNIGLILIDSIVGNIRSREEDDVEISKIIYSISSSLNSISYKYNIPIICTNQVTDIISDIPTFSKLTYKPSLGLSWSNSISTRIFIERPSRTNNSRTFTIIKCPHHPPYKIENISLDQRGFHLS